MNYVQKASLLKLHKGCRCRLIYWQEPLCGHLRRVAGVYLVKSLWPFWVELEAKSGKTVFILYGRIEAVVAIL